MFCFLSREFVSVKVSQFPVVHLQRLRFDIAPKTCENFRALATGTAGARIYGTASISDTSFWRGLSMLASRACSRT